MATPVSATKPGSSLDLYKSVPARIAQVNIEQLAMKVINLWYHGKVHVLNV